MNSSQINKIIKLNNEFYQKTATQFSNSRKYPWKGWFSLLPYLKSIIYAPLSIVDLGCGNGRFLEFLCQNIQNHTFDYLGVDNSDFLLKISQLKAKSVKPKARFKKGDIFNLVELPNKKFDFVVAFGVTHHIPDNNFRQDWFTAVSKLVNKNGYLVLSFWYPNKDKLLDERLEGFEKGDYLMRWGKQNSKRFVHIYKDSELEIVNTIFVKNGFNKELEYKDDIKDTSYNKYLIYKKTS